MRNKIHAMLALGALTGAAVMAAANAGAARELLFSAPIEQLDRGTDTVMVLGQQFHASTAQLAIGQIVNVYGQLQQDGSVTDALVQATQAYGANGDPVFLKGIVTSVDAALGRAEVDGMTVDYTTQLANADFVAPSVGDVIAVAGGQPVSRGVLVATATGDSAYAAGMNGGGTSIAGGMVASTAGSTVTASAVAGMSGGGITSAGMSGGGFTSAGMSGGGITSAGMSGGGFTSAGMSGGGITSAGMSGGGFTSAGMSGGGITSAGMSGGGFTSAGMSGGGITSAGMSGGGFTSAGMSGGGIHAR